VPEKARMTSTPNGLNLFRSKKRQKTAISSQTTANAANV